MTADLVARLLAEADFAHSLIADAVAERRDYLAQREALLREAASALRSSGEAVAWLAADGTGRVIDAKAKAAGDRASATGSATAIYSIPLHPATPASAWRPIAEAPIAILRYDSKFGAAHWEETNPPPSGRYALYPAQPTSAGATP